MTRVLPGVIGQRDAGADADVEDQAAACSRRRRWKSVDLCEKPAEDQVVDRCPARIGAGHASGVDAVRHSCASPCRSCADRGTSASRAIPGQVRRVGPPELRRIKGIERLGVSMTAGTALAAARRRPFEGARSRTHGIGGRAGDETATEDARLALCRIVEDAGLAGRNAILAAGQFNLAAQSRRPSARRAVAAGSSAPSRTIRAGLPEGHCPSRRRSS